MTTAVAQMGATEARALTDQIKVAVEATWELVKRAYVERAWAVLGCLPERAGQPEGWHGGGNVGMEASE